MMSSIKVHTPRAEASLRHAHAQAERLANDPSACIALWESLWVPAVAPHLQAEARRLFRQYIVDPQFRLEFALDAYRSALQLYEEGAFE